MKKIILSLLVIGLTASVSCKKNEGSAKDARDAKRASQEAVAYNVDTGNSVIEWTGSKQTGKHSGVLRLKSGTIFTAGDEIESGNFIIDMNTIEVTDLKPEDGKEDLEAHLKGTTLEEKADHFFNVRKYPEARFEITGIHMEEGKTIIEGNLTIKETTKNIQFPAMVNMTENQISIVSDMFIIDRTQWKVNYGSKSIFSDLGDKFVNDEIELKVTVKATR